MLQELQKADNYIKENRQKVDPTFRPGFHVVTPVGWLNDPNGFVFFQGEYHLFYQFHPYSSQWGPMHWGHVKSKDLIHWEELPVALAPSEEYDKDGCFSGSALVVDGKLALMYTGCVRKDGSDHQIQCMAYSTDGIHFEKSVQNPVLVEKDIEGVGTAVDFRDPKMLYHNGVHYSVIVAKTDDSRGQVLLFESRDATQTWQFKSVLLEGRPDQGIMWECPDLFYLDGKWVLILSPIEMKRQGHAYHNLNSTLAFIGDMDWEKGRFKVENEHEIDGGHDYYAPQTCIDDKGERYIIAWMQMWQRNIPTDDLNHNWAGMITLARKVRVENQQLLQSNPSGLYAAFEETESFQGRISSQEPLILENVVKNQQLLQLSLETDTSWILSYPMAQDQKTAITLSYDATESLLTLSRKGYGYTIAGKETPQVESRSLIVSKENPLQLEVVRDTSSLEVLVNQAYTMSMTFYSREEPAHLRLDSQGDLLIHEFRVSDWKD